MLESLLSRVKKQGAESGAFAEFNKNARMLRISPDAHWRNLDIPILNIVE